MSSDSAQRVQVAVPVPLPQTFTYLLPAGMEAQAGCRVEVPFGRKHYTGLVLQHNADSDVPAHKLKPVKTLLDKAPLLNRELLALVQWSSAYYHHPPGMVVNTALPALLNQGHKAALPTVTCWQTTPEGQRQPADKLPKQAIRQRELLQLLQQYPEGLGKADILARRPSAHSVLRKLEDKGWAQSREDIAHTIPTAQTRQTALDLNKEQQAAVDSICAVLDKYACHLLHGITGSGKTEVYLQIISEVLKRGQQALVLVPEINLTPQMLSRFEKRFACHIALFHSRLNDNERLAAWMMAREGLAPIVIGTRSAIWTALQKPGVIIVDEEHDSSYKQISGFHYSARDLALVRAKENGIPVVLGSATPALESRYNALQKRYHYLPLTKRAGGAKPPRIQVIDMRVQQAAGQLSKPLLQAMHACLEAGQQILLFVTRRGYAPVLMCHACGWTAECRHCKARLTYHVSSRRLHCHHCGAERKTPPTCPACDKSSLNLMGHGTERVEENIQRHFPQHSVLRIDSDSTRRKKSMQNMLDEINHGKADILIGTQMLAKGHHFPKVTLVGILNLDGGLFSADFRATEQTGQLLLQVAGRAGRAENPGQVMIQTWHPQHPMLTCLLQKGYEGFAQLLLEERRQAGLPPFSRLALLRAEAKNRDEMMAFLHQAKNAAQALTANQEVQFWGPASAPLERRAGRYRGQLLVNAGERAALHDLLRRWYPLLSPPARISWSLDVDPFGMF